MNVYYLIYLVNGMALLGCGLDECRLRGAKTEEFRRWDGASVPMMIMAIASC
jgi:hypothetical protein